MLIVCPEASVKDATCVKLIADSCSEARCSPAVEEAVQRSITGPIIQATFKLCRLTFQARVPHESSRSACLHEFALLPHRAKQPELTLNLPTTHEMRIPDRRCGALAKDTTDGLVVA